MNERKSAPTAAEPPSPGGLATPPSPSVTNEPNLPPIAANADDLEALKKAVDDAVAVGGGLWLSYVSALLYIAVAAGAVTHQDLFFEHPVKLPFFNVELPLVAFFALAPILFVVVHAYTLVHLVMLTDKAKRYHQALHDPDRNVTDAARENLQWQLPSNIFIQFLAGPPKVRASLFGWLLRAIAWVTLAIAPVLMLLMMQIQFLPYHSHFVTWTLRVTLGLDLVLIWWLWRKILSGREIDGERRLGSWLWPPLGFALSLAVLVFSVAVVTFPGEWQEELPSWPILPAMDVDMWGKPVPGTESFRGWVAKARKVSLHDWLFSATADLTTYRRLSFSSRLVLLSLNVYEGLGIDEDKLKGREFVFRARGRDLRGATFFLASLPKVDFWGADLRGADLVSADL
jgi:Pentapeptide repeats (8 copies)